MALCLLDKHKSRAGSLLLAQIQKLRTNISITHHGFLFPLLLPVRCTIAESSWVWSKYLPALWWQLSSWSVCWESWTSIPQPSDRAHGKNGKVHRQISFSSRVGKLQLAKFVWIFQSCFVSIFFFIKISHVSPNLENTSYIFKSRRQNIMLGWV